MPLQAKIVILLLTLLMGFATGFGVRSYMAGKQELQRENTALTQALEASTDFQAKVEARDAKIQTLQNQLTALDKDLTNARTEALAENSALRADLAVAERMRLKGVSCPQRPSGTEVPAASGMGHGTEVELSAETRLAVFDLRESIIQDQAALEGCQAYVRRLGLYP